MVPDAIANRALELDRLITVQSIFRHVLTDGSGVRFLVVRQRIEVLALQRVPFAPGPSVAGLEDRNDRALIVVGDLVDHFRNLARDRATNRAGITGDAVVELDLADVDGTRERHQVGHIGLTFVVTHDAAGDGVHLKPRIARKHGRCIDAKTAPSSLVHQGLNVAFREVEGFTLRAISTPPLLVRARIGDKLFIEVTH